MPLCVFSMGSKERKKGSNVCTSRKMGHEELEGGERKRERKEERREDEENGARRRKRR